MRLFQNPRLEFISPVFPLRNGEFTYKTRPFTIMAGPFLYVNTAFLSGIAGLLNVGVGFGTASDE
ncbi:MAG: hypothetical protein LBE17_09890 [Treponema sp.]|jgi:hypothetical protein|nr:hypothetical protein [Treponema sp.]